MKKKAKKTDLTKGMRKFIVYVDDEHYMVEADVMRGGDYIRVLAATYHHIMQSLKEKGLPPHPALPAMALPLGILLKDTNEILDANKKGANGK